MVRRILAFGGGGFAMEPDNPLLDAFVVSLAPSNRPPRVLFVPTASGDAAEYVARFHAAYGALGAETSVLSLFRRDQRDLRSFVLGHDVVFVGGGSTANLLVLWRLHGLDQVLREAYDAGILLSGISAGMNCWFEASVTDSFSLDELQPLHDGLGLLAGSACPHYDGEPLRRPTYRRLVGEGFPAGYAVQDSCAVLFEEGAVADVVGSRAGAGAFRVERRRAGVVEEPLPGRYLGTT